MEMETDLSSHEERLRLIGKFNSRPIEREGEERQMCKHQWCYCSEPLQSHTFSVKFTTNAGNFTFVMQSEPA